MPSPFNGAAGNDGASSAANGSAGGRGAEVNANVPISPGGLFAPGDTQVYVGAHGAGAQGASGDGLAGSGGNGGGLAIVTNTSANGDLLAVAGVVVAAAAPPRSPACPAARGARAQERAAGRSLASLDDLNQLSFVQI